MHAWAAMASEAIKQPKWNKHIHMSYKISGGACLYILSKRKRESIYVEGMHSRNESFVTG